MEAAKTGGGKRKLPALTEMELRVLHFVGTDALGVGGPRSDPRKNRSTVVPVSYFGIFILSYFFIYQNS